MLDNHAQHTSCMILRSPIIWQSRCSTVILEVPTSCGSPRLQYLNPVRVVGVNPLDLQVRRGELAEVFPTSFPVTTRSDLTAANLRERDNQSRVAGAQPHSPQPGCFTGRLLSPGGWLGSFAAVILALGCDCLAGVVPGGRRVQGPGISYLAEGGQGGRNPQPGAAVALRSTVIACRASPAWRVLLIQLPHPGPTVSGEGGGDREQSQPQPLRFPPAGVRAGQGQELRPGGDLGGEGDEGAPGAVLVQAVQREVAQPGLLRAPDPVHRPRWAAVASSRSGSWTQTLLVAKAMTRIPSGSVMRSCAPGWGRSFPAMTRVPFGHTVRVSTPVSSATHAPSRMPPSQLSAGVHTDSSINANNSPVFVGRAKPTEYDTRWAVSQSRNTCDEPAPSVRTKTALPGRRPDRRPGSCASTSRVTAMSSSAVFDPASPGRSATATISPVPAAPWSTNAHHHTRR